MKFDVEKLKDQISALVEENIQLKSVNDLLKKDLSYVRELLLQQCGNEKEISWKNPRLEYLRPISFECLTCGKLFFEVGFDDYDLHEKSKNPHHLNKIRVFEIKPTEFVGPTPCGHFLAERYKGRLGPFDSRKLDKLKEKLIREGRLKNVNVSR